MLFAIDAETKRNRDALAARADETRLEDFIRQNRRFILGVAYKTVHRFVSESDDEWSVALIAFHEAVRSYELEKGSFKQFAALVIKRRLMDEFGKEARHKNEIAADISGGVTDEDEQPSPIQLELRRRISEESIRRQAEAASVRDEIEAMQQLLGGYGFSFFDLADCSPRARKTRDACAAAIRALLEDPALLARLRGTGTLPAKELCRRAGVTRKLLENHRRYIIAAAEILDGDYPHLAEYLRYVRKGGQAL